MNYRKDFVILSVAILLFCTGIAWDSPERLQARSYASKREWDRAAKSYLNLIDKAPYDLNLVREAKLALLYAGQRKQWVHRYLVAGKTAGISFQKAESGWKDLEILGHIFRNAKEQELFLIGMGELFRENYDNAIEKFSEVEKEDSGVVENLIRRGQAHFLAGNLRKSEDDFKAVLVLLPEESEAMTWLARVYQVQGKTKEAQRWFEKAAKNLRNKSQRFEVWFAEFLAQTKNEEMAKQRLEKFTKENPMAVQSLMTLAKIYLRSPSLRHADLWNARKILQIGLSRLDEKSPEWKKHTIGLENSWGLAMDYGKESRKELREEMRVLLTELDLRLQENQ